MVVTEVASQYASFICYRKVTVNVSDLQATSGAGAKTLTLNGVGGVTTANAASAVNSGNLVIPQGAWLLAIRMKVTADVTGGALTAMTASLGFLGGSATGILAAQDVFGATVGFVYAPAATALTTINNTTLLPAYTPTITFTPTTDTVSNATAGQIDIEILYTNISTTTSSTSYTPGV